MKSRSTKSRPIWKLEGYLSQGSVGPRPKPEGKFRLMLTPLQQSVESTVQFIAGTFNLRFFDQNLSTKYICVRCPLLLHTRIKLCSVFRLLKPMKAKVTILLFRSDTEQISKREFS